MPSWCRWLSCLLLLTVSGCSYLKNRANDLLDVFFVDVGVGPGLYAGVRATDLVAVGAGVADQYTAGLHGRFAGTGEAGAWWLGPIVLGITRGEYTPVIHGDDSKYDEHSEPPPTQLLVVPCSNFGREGPNEIPVEHRGLRVADLNAGVVVGYVGARVGFSPGEMLDFVLGILTIDLGGDDAFGRVPPDEADRPKPKWL